MLTLKCQKFNLVTLRDSIAIINSENVTNGSEIKLFSDVVSSMEGAQDF